MDFRDTHTLYLAYALSNAVGLFLLWAAIKRPKVAQASFSLLFAWACWMNYTTSHSHPESYLFYAEKSIGFYRDFINGWFSRHITAAVSSIAVCQGLIAVGLWLGAKSFRLACVGIVLFLAGIAPLGVYAAFPFSLTVAAAAIILLRKANKVIVISFDILRSG